MKTILYVTLIVITPCLNGMELSSAAVIDDLEQQKNILKSQIKKQRGEEKKITLQEIQSIEQFLMQAVPDDNINNCEEEKRSKKERYFDWFKRYILGTTGLDLGINIGLIHRSLIKKPKKVEPPQ